ncbi:MAG: gamma-glutamyltransferase family protein [Thermoproteota archaeon]|nr:gamma-glutamyltransferase family protein [Candidatus Brockarchaeota archaeon]MBO3801571.1 gamma-glutamyltransferase family protein [Candidatus Brockarchaeota archaeon]
MLKTPFLSRNAVVASEHPLASLAGARVMMEGGNAFDAAIAVSLSLAVLQPHLGGLGSDFFALLYSSKNGKVYCINSSGWSPMKLSAEELLSKGIKEFPVRGALTPVVPGLIKGLFEVYNKFATKELENLFRYSISYARDGFPVYPQLSKAISSNINLSEDEGFRENFLPNGNPPSVGQILKQKNLAKALELIKDFGPSVFYEGQIAEKIVDYINSKGGYFSLEDFREFNVSWETPISTFYNGVKVYEIPPNSMGATTLLILNLLEALEAKKYRPFSKERVNLFVKLSKVAYIQRNKNLGDPRFVETNIESFISKNSAKELYNSFKVENFSNKLRSGDTTYFSIIDNEGNIVSAIQSLFYHFGSGLVIPEYGIPLNNRASYFNFFGPNKIEPRKRPLHTLSSVLLENNDEVFLGLGTSGGDFRPQLHALLISNILDYNMELWDAIEAPRFLWEGDYVLLEEGIETIEGVSIKRQKYPNKMGVSQGVTKKNGSKVGVCDIRGDGLPIGF